ncbi:outer membrane protein [Phreatobacter sp.]|uniref:outer membrane protein n=1 Tax=Phreatobacter sp. TaxID=1966341 RepID=UPI003F717C30
MKRLFLATTALVAFAAGAQAADLAVPRSPIASAVVMPAFSWTGFYVGVHAGFGFGRSTGFGPGPFPANTSGPLIGGQVGFNYQINQIVLGAEADLAFAAISGRDDVTLPGFAAHYRTHMLGSVRARAGVAVDRALLYVTGGLGIQGGSFATNPGPGPERYSRLGWTVGAGVEYAITPNWTAKLEYSYYNFGTHTLGPLYVGTVQSHVHTVKVGLNYLFSTGSSAVVARY